jgi:hypothetical protein
MAVLGRKAEARIRLFLEVDLDQHGRLVADDPRVVAGLITTAAGARNSNVQPSAYFPGDAAADEEPDVRVPAAVGVDLGPPCPSPK